MQPTYTYVHACARAHTHTHKHTTKATGRHFYLLDITAGAGWGGRGGPLCLVEGPVAQTWLAMLPRDMSEETFPSVQAQREWILLEELIGSAQHGRQEPELGDCSAFPAV